jgi:ATP-dependent protease ClpP protease subunit
LSAPLSEPIKAIVDVSEEKEGELKKTLLDISKRENAVLMACIAPYVGKQVSPTRILTAELGISEEFAIESVIEQIKDRTDTRTLYLLLNSPGGYISSSYKVARALRSSFKNIKLFVPHIAASGGTLVALAGNQIVMGMMSQLSPIDPHGTRGKREISAKSLLNGFETVTDFFRKIAEQDAPYTYKVLAQKYDAELLDEAVSSLLLMQDYASEILSGSGYKKEEVIKIAKNLARGFKNHSEVINYDKAKKLGLKVVLNTKCAEDWSTMRAWLGQYLLQSADKNIIRFVISQDLIKPKPKNNVRKPETKSEALIKQTSVKPPKGKSKILQKQ